MKISKIRLNESYKLRFYKKQKGLNQGNLDHEEFFDTKAEAVSRYKEVFDRNAYSLNPTMWVGDGDNWKRLSEVEINESLKEDFEDYEDRLFYRKSDRLENSVEKRFPGWKIFVEGSWQCGIGSDFIYIYPPDDIKLEDDPLSIYLDGSFLDISNREILKLIAQEIKPVIQANESLNESSKSNASLTFKNNSGALELYAYNYVDPDLSDEEAIEYKERPYWKNWYKTRSEAVEDYKIIDSICNKYNVRIWPHDNHTFNNKNEVEIVGPSKNIIKKALNELRRRYDFEMIDESLKEDFDPKSYNQALDDYMSSKNISVEKLFGALNYDDPRYKQLFNSLKDLGYKPRETGTYSRGYFVPAMTITVSTRKVPDDVIDLIHKLAGVTGRHIGFHKGANNWKLKFELRDDDFSSFKDKIFQSLNESTWNDEKGNPQPSTVKYKGFKIRPSGSAQHLNIYDSHNELVDSGFKTLAKAKKFCDENEDLAESLNQDVTDIPSSTMFKMDPDKFAQFCRQEGWLQNMSRDEWQYLQYDIAHGGRKLFALANDIKACGTHRNLSTQEIAETLFDMMQDENNNMVESLKRKLRKKFKETLDNGKIDSREDDILDKVFAYLRQEKGDEEFVEFAKKTLGLTDSELKTFCGLCEGYDESKYIVWYNLDGEENYIIISALNEDDAVDKFSINLDPSLITDVHEVVDYGYHAESLEEDKKITRYSDVLPQKDRDRGWWYFTTHGVGPGTIPKDLNVLEVRDGQNKKGTWGTFVRLDGIVNTSELSYYDLTELAPPNAKNESLKEDDAVDDDNFLTEGFLHIVKE